MQERFSIFRTILRKQPEKAISSGGITLPDAVCDTPGTDVH